MKVKFIKTNKITHLGVFALLVMLAFSSCIKSDVETPPINSEQQVIADYVAKLKVEEDTTLVKYSEFASVLEKTGVDALLSIRGPFTLFLPTNEAFAEYCKVKNVNSIMDLDTAFLKRLVYNHIVPTSIQTGDIGHGALRDENGLGDKLATELQGSDIIINKYAKITKRDIKASNGYMHEINSVLDPIDYSLYDLIKSDPSYSLFTRGLEETGLKDTLKIVQIPYGKKFARTRFTVLAVPDTIFNRYGINTFEELVKYFTDDATNLTSMDNAFYRYIEYHCIGGTYYMSDFESKLYPILSYDNNISMKLALYDFQLNYDKTDSSFTTFIFDQSNVPAKNGALHALTDLLPVVEPAPTAIEFEVTDYFDVKQGDYFGKYYKKWFDGQNDLQYIKWEGDYLQYYFKDPSKARPNKNWDCLNMTGYWWVEVTTPKIMKGKYDVSGFIWDNQASFAVYIDGVHVTTVINDVGNGNRPVLGQVNWEKTESHKIKLVAITYGSLFWDTLTFTPVN